MQPDASHLRSSPSRMEVRNVACPRCGAVAGRPCRDPAGASR
ncbi:zinc finger domain-containing protein [Streptomyces sp. NBC_01451]